MRYVYRAICLVLFFCSFYICPAKVIKRVSVYYKEDRVNTTHFAYRLDSHDGVAKESWYINEQPATHQEFENALCTAEQEERIQKRAKKRVNRLKAEQLQAVARRMRAQEKLAKIVKAVEKTLSNLTHYDVEPYYTFSANNITSKADLSKLRYELIPAAQLACDSRETSLSYVQELLGQLEEYPEKLTEFFYATIDNALATCSDTKLLKKLLALVPDSEIIN